ncbi:MAG: GPW/gp25 family protein [Reichenbachiella sp.]|uniref:GPW/gp25 family protein n=1 Tax=Reichenbachiella sp. TaxID=2184521 RepID=UPI0032649A7C
MSNEEKSFLGRGWSFPPAFDSGTKTASMVSDEEDIRQSLFIILSTRKGERVINPDFGCGINELVFEEIDTSIRQQVIDLVSMAILYYEPRINLIEIKVDLDQQLDGRLNIKIDYNIKNVNKRSNMVYPFYFLEGTDLRFG